MNKISVIIPVYNAERYLKKCLDTVINQTIEVYEIILINDGSTDLSGIICNEYLKQYKNIKVIHKQNEGVSAARNAGLKVASGDLISFVDADDCLENDMYEILVNTLNDYQSDIVHCGYKRMSEDDIILKECFGTHRIIEQNSKQAIANMLTGKIVNCGLWNKIYRKTVLKNCIFDEHLKNNEDILFNFIAFQNSSRIVFVDETKYLYYNHSTSTCNILKKLKQLKDSVEASRLMIEANNDITLLSILNYRYYESCMKLYRYLLLTNSGHIDIQEIKQNTKSLYKRDFKKNYKVIMNYSMLMRAPLIYKIIYKLYSKIRTPKWDVVNE